MYNASEGPASLTLTFASGVVIGATYDCSVKLRKDNYTSAKSAPAIVTVTAGRYLSSWVHLTFIVVLESLDLWYLLGR